MRQEKGGFKIEIQYLKIRQENGTILYGGNQGLFSKRVKKSGCGLIAALDLAVYISENLSEPIPLSEYNHKVSSAEAYFYKNSPNLFGISSKKIIRYLSEKLNGKDFLFIHKYKLSKNALSELIRKSLSENIPVIIRIGENFKRLPYKIIFPNGVNHKSKMRWHYITAVGLKNETLIFYSWGGRGEMDINDLWRYFGFTGGIILPTDMYK